jgi:hypothetical protein
MTLLTVDIVHVLILESPRRRCEWKKGERVICGLASDKVTEARRRAVQAINILLLSYEIGGGGDYE